MSFTAVLLLGFFLGMRHATDADHAVAVSTIVSRARTLRSAAPIGISWGLGHTLTIMLVGSAIIVFGVAIPPHIGLGMELGVAVMLVALGALNLRSVIRREDSTARAGLARSPARALFVGIVHGLAGSAAIALLVLGTIRSRLLGIVYLVDFSIGTITGMLLVSIAIAVPIVATARRFARFHRALGFATGIGSVVFGVVLFHDITFTHHLFSSHPLWTPR